MKIAVGMSGGVDSAAAALLLKEAGHDVFGLTMRLWRKGRYAGGGEGSCFGPGEEKSIADARQTAARLGIDHHVLDVHERYVKEVVEYFRDTYLGGETPNPCVRCNARIKFDFLPRMAHEAGLRFERFATGHYARVYVREGRYALQRATDRAKDQSYFLAALSQEQLARVIFPLGQLTKEEARAACRRADLAISERPDSQDFCTGGTEDILATPDRAGEIVDASGRVLGRHNGFWHFTIGQRKGLGIGGAGEPYYVVDVNACANRVIVGRRDEIARTSFSVKDVNAVAALPGEDLAQCRVKIRSAGEPRGPARFADGRCTIPSGVFGVAPGQYAVFYDETDTVLAAGTISR